MSSQPIETDITRALTAANDRYIASNPKVNLPLPPSKHYAIITCMDARLAPTDPSTLGVHPGDAHIIRNAGGSARDALRSLLISQHLLGTDEVLVIKHTGCGMLTFQDEEVKTLIGERQGQGGKDVVRDVVYGAFEDLEREVRRDVEFLKGCEALKARGRVSGWVWEVETGRVRRVV